VIEKNEFIHFKINVRNLLQNFYVSVLYLWSDSNVFKLSSD